MNVRPLYLAVAALSLGATAVSAQSASAPYAQGVQAYQQLELTSAGRLLRLALSINGSDSLAVAERNAALMYLFAIEVLNNRRDSSVAVSQRLLAIEPQYQPDAMIFPPEIVTAFDRRRREVKLVVARAPDQAVFRPREETFRITLVATSFHQVLVTAVKDGTPLVTLYDGPIDDSVDVAWNGLDGEGRDAPGGRYTLSISSRDTRGRVIRTIRVPFEVRAAAAVASFDAPIARDAEPELPRARRTVGLAGAVGFGMYSGTSRTFTGDTRLSGPGLAGEGRLSYGPVALQIGYAEATLKAEDNELATRSQAEGNIMLGVRTLPWLTFWVGPHARGWTSEAGNQRWLLWEIRAEASYQVIPDRLGLSLAGWSVAQGSVDAPEPFDRGMGLQGRLDLRLGSSPLLASLSYRFEQARIKQDAQRESNNVLGFWLRYERRD